MMVRARGEGTTSMLSVSDRVVIAGDLGCDPSVLAAGPLRHCDVDPCSFDELPAALAAAPTHAVVIGLGSHGGAEFAMVTRARKISSAALLVVVPAERTGDRVVAFELGADDVIAAPFDPEELLARLRRLRPQQLDDESEITEPAVRAPGILIDLSSREVIVEGTTLQLANREFELLAYLSRYPRRAFTREELLQAVWGSSAQWQDPATVTEHIRRIRTHLSRFKGASGSLQTVRGHGYRFVPPTEAGTDAELDAPTG
jgi:two-component system, OmpR family, response regulator RegX3